MPSVFTIDENDLDGEWRNQPKLMRDAGLDEADAKHELSLANAALEVVQANLKLRIRRAPETFDLPEKPTVSDIEAAMIASAEYQQALEKVHKAEHEVGIMTARKNAMIDRRKALENLVDLLTINYYSEREMRPTSEAGRQELETRRRHKIRGSPDDA